MKKVVLKLVGAGQEELFNTISSLDNYEVAAFTDSKIAMLGKTIKGTRIISVYEVVDLYAAGNVDAVVMDSGAGCQLVKRMRDELVFLGVNSKDVLVAKPEFYSTHEEQDLVPADEYHCMPYIEYHVVDSCNLNCRACAHFSPLVPEGRFADYGQVKADLERLHEIVPYIDDIHILGGEPLLNKELDKYLDLTRTVYPYASITIVTNGLLLKNIDSVLVAAIKRNNIHIEISLYPPMFSHIQQVIEKLKALDIPVTTSEPKKEFDYSFDEEGGHLKWVQRIHCACHNLYQGKVALCPSVAYIDYFNEAFQKSFDGKPGQIDIYDKTLTFEQLVKRLHTPIEMCDRCLHVSAEDRVTLDWSQTKEKSYDDYVFRHGNSL